MPKVVFCTVNLVGARAIAWAQRGYGHAALVSERHPGMWLDARATGVTYRAPETGLHASEEVELPFDIEEAAIKHLGERYNFRGLFAFAFHFYWHARGVFCSQAILQWCRESGHSIVPEGTEDLISPIECCRLLKAYTAGLKGAPQAAQ